MNIRWDRFPQIWGILFGVCLIAATPLFAQGGDEDSPSPLEVPMPPPSPDDQRLAREVSVMIYRNAPLSGIARATGFFVSADGYVVTDDHVVRELLAPETMTTYEIGLVFTYPADEVPLDLDAFKAGGGKVVQGLKPILVLYAGDIALVKLDLPPEIGPVPYIKGIHPASLGQSAAEQLDGKTAVVAGAAPPPPGQAEHFRTDGMLCRLRGHAWTDRLMMFDYRLGGVREVQLDAPRFMPVNQDPVRITDWSLHLHSYPMSGEGFSGGPVLLDGMLLGLVQADYSRPPMQGYNFLAMPGQLIQSILGLGEPDFVGEQGYQLPAAMQAAADAGENPFDERLTAFLQYQTEEVEIEMTMERLFHLLALASEISSRGNETAGSVLTHLTERYGKLGHPLKPEVDQFMAAVVETDEVFVADYLSTPDKLSLPAGGNLTADDLAVAIARFIKQTPAGILVIYASRVRPVVLQLFSIGAQDDPSASVQQRKMAARIVEKLDGQGFEFAIQFGPGSPVYFLDKRDQFLESPARPAIELEHGYSLTPKQMIRAFAILTAFQQDVAQSSEEGAAEAAQELRALLEDALSEPTAINAFATLAASPGVGGRTANVAGLPDEITDAIETLRAGRASNIGPGVAARFIELGLIGSELPGVDVNRTTVRQALVDTNAFLKASGRKALAEGVVAKVGRFLNK